MQEALLFVRDPDPFWVPGRSFGVSLADIGGLRGITDPLLIQCLDPELVVDPGREGHPADHCVVVWSLIQEQPLVGIKWCAVLDGVVYDGQEVVEAGSPQQAQLPLPTAGQLDILWSVRGSWKQVLPRKMKYGFK